MDILKSASHPLEVWALVKFSLGGGQQVILPELDHVSNSMCCLVGLFFVIDTNRLSLLVTL